MIQRIQTVYLTAALILECLMLFMPWVQYTSGDVVYVFSLLTAHTDGGVEGGAYRLHTLPLAICVFISMGLTLYTIAGFKDRKKQVRVAWWNILLMLVILGVFAFLHFQAIQSLKEVAMEYEMTVALPLIAVVFTWLAIKAIRKDEDLVRSADRLR